RADLPIWRRDSPTMTLMRDDWESWWDPIESLLVALDGIAGVCGALVVGALFGIGAAELLSLPLVVGAVVGAVLFAAALILLSRARPKEEDRNAAPRP